MKLREILEKLGPAVFISQDLDNIDIRGISADSRQVKQGYLFVAIPGTEFDGRRFVHDALIKGASALVMSRRDALDYIPTVPDALPVIGVDNPRSSTGLLASAFYGNPSRTMAVASVTGTNGKTTVTYLLEGIFRQAGLNPGVIGTVNQRHGGMEIPSDLTTPDAVKLQKTLNSMLKAGAKAAALEVSSHALDQHRVSGCSFAASIFTNLTRDHLDYHHDMERYFQAKVRLFLEYPSGTAIINMDDPHGRRLLDIVQGEKISYGLSPEAQVRPKSLTVNPDGIACRITTTGGDVGIKSELIGTHNVYNILAAVAASIAMGIDPDQIETGIEAVTRIPGRLDPVHAPQGVKAFVDYAHTPVALESILNSLAGLGTRPLICVIGCGGDRDQGKRPLMAQAAASLSDIVVLTSDNPRTEDPNIILEQMLKGLRDLPSHHRANKAEVKVMPDRKDAILWAAERAQPGACVLVAGKGHEIYQIVGDKRIDFDDREVLRKAFEARNGRRGTTGEGQRAKGKGIETIGGVEKGNKTQDQGLGLNVSQVARATGARILNGDPEIPVQGISTNSRAVKKGDLFWALSGQRFDGHEFVSDAIKAGAIGAVVHSSLPPFPLPLAFCPHPVMLKVPDTLKALGDMAAWYKDHIGIKVIGITGSCGKTTTKELVFSVLKKRWKAAKTHGNFNNLIGLPLSLLSARSGDAWAVLEMGTNQPGEIARLCEISGPQVGLITTIQPAHLAGLGDIKNVAREKWDLLKALPQKGTAVVNLDDPLVTEGAKNLTCRVVGYSMGQKAPASSNLQIFKSSNHQITCLSWAPTETGTLINLDIAHSRISVHLSLIGKANVQNAVAAAATGHAIGLTPVHIKQGLEEVKPFTGRLFQKKIGPQWSLIDDSYNANPGSMKAALETLKLWNRGEKRVAILGDMLELGESARDFHHDIGQLAVHAGVDLLISVGRFADTVAKAAVEAGLPKDAIRIFPDTMELLSWIESSAPDHLPCPATILVKGSRAIGLERAVDYLTRHLEEG